MSTPNPALESAIVHFAQQPGVSPADVSQLRSALASDTGLASKLDAAAASGALHGFAPAAPGAADRPIGDYDRASGIVTLPLSSLTAQSPTDLHAALRVQSMVVDFGSKSYTDAAKMVHPVTPDMLGNLQDTINRSPALAQEIKRAATSPDPLHPSNRILESFDFTPPGAGVGGSFSAASHTMNLVSDSLMTNAPPGSKQKYDAYNLTFVIGHEVQHGFNAQAAELARDTFRHHAQALAATPGPIHDYTALVENYIQANREDEAKAEISGWNALHSRVSHDNGSVTLTDMSKIAQGRTLDFIEVSATTNTWVPRPNIQLNTDLTISQTPANVAAMGYNYFDRPVHPQLGDTRQPMALGPNKDTDYSNRDAGWAIATIGIEEKYAVHRHGVAPQVQINMAHAGLHEEMMERAGLNLAPSTPSIPYLDSSTQPAVPHTFNHTASGPNQFQYVPVAPAAPNRLDDPQHADHALFQQARGHVAALDQSLGRTPDQHTDQISSSLAVQARADGLHRIDQVALSTDGNRLWAVQTPPGRTDHLFDLRTSVPTAEAMTPLEQSAAKWPEAMQQFQQNQVQQQAQSQQATQSQEQGPVMSHGSHGR